MNLFYFFVQTSNLELLIEQVSRFADISIISRDQPIPLSTDCIVANPNTLPTSFTIYPQQQWSVVEINSPVKLHQLGQQLSASADGYFLQTIYCHSTSYAYFLLYQQGTLIREIQSNRHQQLPDIDAGEPLPWEQEPVEYFDLDIIATFCHHLGLDISNLIYLDTCIILQSATTENLISLNEEQKIQQVFSSIQ